MKKLFTTTSVLLIALLFLTTTKAQEYIDLDNVKLASNNKGMSNKTLLLLLSGPTDNWHSDQAWWILGQNYLSQTYPTIGLERAGQGFSEIIEKPSYTDFSKRLSQYIKQQKQPLIIVAFASSNLSVQIMLQDSKVAKKVKGIVFIDPDVLTEHSIKHYTGESEGYRKNWQQLEDYIKAGKYQQRINEKIDAERKHLTKIINGELQQFMDWNLYARFENLRRKPEYQINKFKEVTAYKVDLKIAMDSPVPVNIPVVILDSDFETGYLETIKNEQVKVSIIQWRDEGKAQFFNMASKNPCGAYWPIDSQEHLVTFTHPHLIQRAVERIENCN